MIIIVHLEHSRSERIIWLMEELGLPYQVQSFARRPDIFAPDAMKETHRLGRAPVIIDGRTVLAESGAIIEYILARYGQGQLSVGPEAPNFAQYLYWMHYTEGSLMLNLSREWAVDRMMPDADAHPGMARFRETTRNHFGMIEETLAASPYIAGEAFTAADIMMAYPFTTYRRFRPIDLAPYPAIAAWVARLSERPAFQKAVATEDTNAKEVV